MSTAWGSATSGTWEDTTQHHDFGTDGPTTEILRHRDFADRIRRRMDDDPLARGIPAEEAIESMRNRGS